MSRTERKIRPIIALTSFRLFIHGLTKLKLRMEYPKMTLLKWLCATNRPWKIANHLRNVDLEWKRLSWRLILCQLTKEMSSTKEYLKTISILKIKLALFIAALSRRWTLLMALCKTSLVFLWMKVLTETKMQPRHSKRNKKYPNAYLRLWSFKLTLNLNSMAK